MVIASFVHSSTPSLNTGIGGGLGKQSFILY